MSTQLADGGASSPAPPSSSSTAAKSWTAVACADVPNPTVRSGNKAVAWRVAWDSSSSSSSSSSSAGASRLGPRTRKKRAGNRGTTAGDDSAAASAGSFAPALATRRTHLPNSFAAAARRGNKKKGAPPAKANAGAKVKPEHAVNGDTDDVAVASTSEPFPALPSQPRSPTKTVLPDLAKKKRQDAEARGRKLLLMLSSTNVDDLADDLADELADPSDADTNKTATAAAAPVSNKFSLGIGSKTKTSNPTQKRGSWADAADEEDDAEEARLQKQQFTAEAAEKAKKRLKLWRTLFKNVNRTADELYYLCEFESDADHASEAMELMFSWMNDFQSLFDRLVSQTADVDEASAGKHVTAFSADGVVSFPAKETADEQHSLSSSALNKTRSGSLRRVSREAVAWEVKTSSPQNLDRSNSVVSALQNISPPRARKQQGEGKAPHRQSSSSSASSRPKSQKIIHIEDFEASCSTASVPVTLSLSVEQHQTPKLFRGVMMPRDSDNSSSSSANRGSENVGSHFEGDDRNSNSGGAFGALESSGQSTDSGGNTTGGENVANIGNNEEDDGGFFERRSLGASGDSEYFRSLDAQQEHQRISLRSTTDEITALLDKSAAAGAAVDTTTGGEILNAKQLLLQSSSQFAIGTSPPSHSRRSSAPSSPTRAEISGNQLLTTIGHNHGGLNSVALSKNQHEKTRQRQLQRELHAKLMSPERRKPSPIETKQRLKQKQSTAEINRRRLDSARMARLNRSTDRVRAANERRQQKLAQQQRGMIARLNDSEARRRNHLREKAESAKQQNLKVDEIAFINSLQSQSRKLMLNERLEKGRQRRAENLDAKVARQRNHHAKVQGARGTVQAKVDEESKRTREKLDKRAQRAEARRQEELKKRTEAATRKDVAERVQKNKEEQERKRLGVQERRKERMWHKVERASNRKLKFTSRDDASGVSGGEYVEEGMYGSDHGVDNLVSGVNIMPCLVSNNKGSPRSTNSGAGGADSGLGTPPASPLRGDPPRRNSRRRSQGVDGSYMTRNKGNPFFLSAAESDGGLTTDGNTDGETSPSARARRPPHQRDSDSGGGRTRDFELDDAPRGSGIHQSPRKQFRSAIANGNTVELASDLFDRAKQEAATSGLASKNDGGNDVISRVSSGRTNKSRSKSRKASKKTKNRRKKKSGSSKPSNNASPTAVGNKSGGSPSRSGSGSNTSAERAAKAIVVAKAKNKSMKKRMKKYRDKIKKLPWVDLNVDEDSGAGDDDDVDNDDDLLAGGSSNVVSLGIGCYSEGAVDAMKKARPKLYQLYTDLVLHADKSSSESLAEDNSMTMIAAAQASGYFEKDSRVLGLLLAELDWRLDQHTTDRDRQKNMPKDRRPARGTSEENGWHRLVRNNGVDILIKFAFADVCLDVEEDGFDVEDDGNRRINSKQRKHQLLALEVLETLVQHSAAACFALCSSSCILFLVGNTKTSLQRCTKALAAWNTARRVNGSSGGGGSSAGNEQYASSLSLNASSNAGSTESSENIDHEYFFCKQATSVLLMATKTLGHISPAGSDQFIDSMFTWPPGFGVLFVQYTACAGLWDAISELLRKCSASKYGLLAQPHLHLMQRSLNFVEAAMLVYYSGTEKRQALARTRTSRGSSEEAPTPTTPNVVTIPLALREAFIDTCVHAMLHLVEALAETEKVRSKHFGGAGSAKKTSTKHRGRKPNQEAGAMAQFNRHGASPIPFGSTTVQTQEIILTIAEHNIDVFQEALNAPGIQNEVYHVFSFLLEYCTTEPASRTTSPSRGGATASLGSLSGGGTVSDADKEKLLDNIIVLMGYYARGSPQRQQSLHWGSHPTPLQRLCTLPFRYFSKTSAKAVLFPTLIAICHNDERNTSVVEEECSIDMLTEFIRAELLGVKASIRSAAGALEKENTSGASLRRAREDAKANAWGSSTTKSDFAVRVPATSWQDALVFFENA